MKLSNEQKNITIELLKFKKPVQTLGGYAGTGKSQRLDALVYTPFGPKRMGDIEVGDQVSNPDGSVTTVIGVFPQGKLPVYKVSFIDGASTIVSGDHLWRVKISSKKYKAKKSMLDGGDNIKEEIATTDALRAYLERNKQRSRPRYPLVPFTLPVQFTMAIKLLMNPYLLGLLLGDGGLKENVRFTTVDDFICEQIVDIIDDAYELRPVKNSDCNYTIVKKKKTNHENVYTEVLRHYGLLGKHSYEKFIPDVYKLSTLETRWDLLQGLMDTDGCAECSGNNSKSASYCTTSSQLAKDVQWLVRSLGGKATISEKHPTYTHNGEKKTGRLAYNLYIQIPEKSRLFRLPRKKERCVDQFNGGFSILRNRMVSIEPAGVEECQCIQVDHPNSLYITDDFIVTHNTTLISHIMRAKPNFAVCAYTGKAADVLRRKGIQATTIHSLIYAIKKGEDGKAEMDEHGNPVWELKPSLEADGIIVDEASMVDEELYQDLLSFNLPVIFVGDHGQLEPVRGKFNLMVQPDFTLEEIHRNAGDIARFAEWIRMGYLPAAFQRKVTTDKVIFLNKWQMEPYLTEADQVLCAFNKTRVDLNTRIRARIGFQSQEPEVNDRVMCLRNNKKLGLFNGMQGRINYLYKKSRMQFKSEQGDNYDVTFDRSIFGKVQQNVSRYHDDPEPFDWCYAVTVHKAQGDEWDELLVLEQKSNQWDHRRWAYTAASRAKTRLYWVYN